MTKTAFEVLYPTPGLPHQPSEVGLGEPSVFAPEGDATSDATIFHGSPLGKARTLRAHALQQQLYGLMHTSISQGVAVRTTTTPVPLWLPPDGQIRIRPLGEVFDAVRVPSFQGLYAVHRLRLSGLGGPVIEDPAHGVMYWLIPPGAANGRGWPPGVVALGRGYCLAIPAADRIGGPWVGDGEVRWLVVPPARDCLTDPEVLYLALSRVFGGRCG